MSRISCIVVQLRFTSEHDVEFPSGLLLIHGLVESAFDFRDFYCLRSFCPSSVRHVCLSPPPTFFRRRRLVTIGRRPTVASIALN